MIMPFLKKLLIYVMVEIYLEYLLSTKKVKVLHTLNQVLKKEIRLSRLLLLK
jgi:hypothetical protein